ncbi:hypothetical protein BUE80_DR011350 [Diplocarpon rosae]|nr:hypothetical protein BUE80_DR011350 [Diplocarpon rosae]
MGRSIQNIREGSGIVSWIPTSVTCDTAPSHYNFALQQYGKALTRLRESLENKEARSDRMTLISIVWFTCFQSSTGDHRAAIKQIQYGLGLLEEGRQKSNQPLIRRKGEKVEDKLVRIFTRLAVQAKSYDMAFFFPHPYVIRLSPPNPPLTNLPNLKEIALLQLLKHHYPDAHDLADIPAHSRGARSPACPL